MTAPRDTPVRDEPQTEAGRALVLIAATQSIHLGHLPEPLGRIVARIEAEAQRLTVERLAWAYHQTRLRYPGGSLFCGDEHGNPYDLDDATCSCRLDMMDVAEAYVRGPALAHPEEEQRP